MAAALDDAKMAKIFFGVLLAQIEQNETNYAAREGLVYTALGYAAQLGYPCGIRVDPAEPEWPVVCIELPGEGEVSWHCPARKVPFAGYATEEKYARCRRYVAAAARK